MTEYEKLTGSNDYFNLLKRTSSHYAKLNYLNVLKGCYLLMGIGRKDSLRYLKRVGIYYDKVSPENINKLRSKILAYRTRLEIENVIKKEVKEKKLSFDEVISNLENALGRNIDENMTVSKYISLVNSVNSRKVTDGK
ncbi:hypothetical protein KAR91_36840 [Candidatus Pacearchaeota archaeon]|nr:hypothetical protein [Candidatus Pacearchaeota archaeon]